MSSESFIYASILQHCSAMPFSLYMYSAVYPIFIPCFWQKFWKAVLINSPLPSIHRQSSLLLQASAL